MGTIDLDAIFQPAFEGYSVSLSGLLALYAPHYRVQIEPNYSFRLVSKVSDDSWIVIQDTFDLLDRRYGSWQRAATVPCCMFVGLAFESLRVDPRFSSVCRDPAVQFLRHLRNAAYHGNRFNIHENKVDPTTSLLFQEASWRSVRLTPGHNGVAPFFEVLEIGDPLRLLQDISRLL